MSIEILAGATDTNLPMFLYQNIFEDGTVTVSSETADGFASNAFEDTTFDFWTAATAIANVTVDYGSDVECDCLGISAHTLAAEGASVRLLGSDDDVTYDVVFAYFAPLIDETILFIFPPTTYRYWRVQVANGPASIGVIKLGKKLSINGGVLSGHVGISHAKRVEMLSNTSVKGQFIGTRIKRIGAETDINLGMIDRDFVEGEMLMLEEYFNTGRTFFFASCPADYPDDYGYCKRGDSAGEMRPSYEEGGALMNVSMAVDCYVEQ